MSRCSVLPVVPSCTTYVFEPYAHTVHMSVLSTVFITTLMSVVDSSFKSHLYVDLDSEFIYTEIDVAGECVCTYVCMYVMPLHPCFTLVQMCCTDMYIRTVCVCVRVCL